MSILKFKPIDPKEQESEALQLRLLLNLSTKQVKILAKLTHDQYEKFYIVALASGAGNEGLCKFLDRAAPPLGQLVKFPAARLEGSRQREGASPERAVRRRASGSR